MASSREMLLMKPLNANWKISAEARTRPARKRFAVEPKSNAPSPPQKVLAPTGIKLMPMAVSTTPITTGGNSFSTYL